MSYVPHFELPTFERRNPWGWILLVLVLGLAILGSMAMYFGRDKYEIALSRYVTYGGNEFWGKGAKEKLELALKDLESPAEELERNLAYRTVIRHELGMDPIDKDLSRLANSGEDSYAALAEVYKSEALTPEQAKALGERIREARSSVVHRAITHARTKAGLDPPMSEPVEEMAMLMGLGVMALMAGGVGVYIVFFVLMGTRKLVPKGYTPFYMSKTDGDRFALRAAQIMLLFVGISLIAPFLIGKVHQDVLSAGLPLTIVAIVLLLTNVPVSGKKITFEWLGLHFRDFGKHLLWGLGGALAVWPLMIFVLLIMLAFPDLPPPINPLEDEVSEPSRYIGLLLVIMAVICAPIWEEILFRGHIFPAVKTVTGSVVWGAIASGVFFAALHPTGLQAWPLLASVGVISSILAYYTGSLMPSVIMHAIHNGIIVSMTLSGVGG